MSTVTSAPPVAVIGAGPVGMAAAAQLATRGMPFVVLESGESVAASVTQWAHVRLFSPWRITMDPAARDLLLGLGWEAPDPEQLPTGGELISRYLAPLAAHPALAPHIRYGTTVTAIARQGVDRVRTAGRENTPFVIRLAGGDEILASAVIDASGTWLTVNPLGGNGLSAQGEADARAGGRVFDAMPDVAGAQRSSFAGKSVAVVGAGHSATGTLLALAELAEQEPATTVHWILRSPDPARAYGSGAADELPARSSIGSAVKTLVAENKVTVHTGFFVSAVTAQGVVSADGRTVPADVIVNATGARPDHRLADELRLDLDPILGSTRALAPLIDPNVHSCNTVPAHGEAELAHPEPGFYIVGAKSYGRAPTFLLSTGYEQVRSVVAALDGDWEAAHRVQLAAPAASICSPAGGQDSAPPACGTTPAHTGQGLSTGLLTLPLVQATTAQQDDTSRLC